MITETNGTANGTAAKLLTDRQRLRDLRRQVAAGRAKIELTQLNRTQKLLEALTASDTWVSLFSDRLERFRVDPTVFSASNIHDRRYGRDIPIYSTESELAMLRMQSRILCATNSYAIGLMNGIRSYLIGPGFTYRAVPAPNTDPIDALVRGVQWVMENFFERNEWYGGEDQALESEFFERSCEDGEAIWSHWTEDEHTYIRTVEPEQLTQPPAESWEEWSFGIHTPRWDTQKKLGYWIYYGDTPSDGQEYPASDITHFKRNVKRSIKRGVTDFSFDTQASLQIASRLRNNMTLGAAIQASYSGIRQHDNVSQAEVQSMADLLADYQRIDPVTNRTENYQRHEPGMVDIPKGMNFVNPPSATNAAMHVEILRACLESAGRRWQAPTWMATGSASDMGAYTSSEVAEAPFPRLAKGEQRRYKAVFLKSIWKAVCHYANTRGIAGYNGEQIKQLIEIQAEPPSVEARNLLEEAQANQIRVQGGWKSRQKVAAEEGLDFEEEVSNMEEYAERMGGPGSPLELPGEPGVTISDKKPEEGKPLAGT